MNFVNGWNQLISVFPAGLLLALTLIGAAIAVIFILKWIWEGRRGGGISMKTFPWLAMLFAAVFAGPTVVVPALLLLVQALVTIFVTLLTFFVGLLGR